MAALRAVPDSPPRAVIYLRQSTHREESISLELQETAARDYAARQGYVIVGVEADPGISGRTWKRPAVQRVMAMVEGGEADVIVLWRWSRLSRSRKDWAVAADRVDVAGGRIESATEPNDTVTAAGRFSRGVMVEMNAFESERIGEQWIEVHQRRRALGLPGGGKIPYGWRYAEDGSIERHPDQAEAVRAMYDLYLSGHGARKIMEWLESHGHLTYSGRAKWSYSTIGGILDTPFHAGFIVHKGRALPGAHEPIISPEMFERYQAMRRERAGRRAVKYRYLLSGIASCAICGKPMFGLSVTRRGRESSPYFAYRCAAISTVAYGSHGPSTISTRILDQAVMSWLQTYGDKLDTHEPDLPPRNAQLDAQRIAREITDVDKQVVNLTAGLASGLVPERAYRSTVDELEARRELLVAALREVEDRIVLMPERPREKARSLIAEWDERSLEAKRQSLREILAGIDVDCRRPRTARIRPRWGDPVTIDL